MYEYDWKLEVDLEQEEIDEIIWNGVNGMIINENGEVEFV